MSLTSSSNQYSTNRLIKYVLKESNIKSLEQLANLVECNSKEIEELSSGKIKLSDNLLITLHKKTKISVLLLHTLLGPASRCLTVSNSIVSLNKPKVYRMGKL